MTPKPRQQEPQKFDMANFYMKRRGETYYEYIDTTANGTDERLARTYPFIVNDPVLISSQSTSQAYISNDKRMSIHDLDISQAQI